MTNAELELALSLALAEVASLRARVASGGAVAQPAQVLAAAPAQAQAQPEPAGGTIGAWLDVYAAILAERPYKPATVKNHTANIAHVRRLWGALPIRSLRPHAITTGLKEFLPKRASTAKRVLGELRDAYTEAVANDWCDNNPAIHVKMPKCKVKRARLRIDTWQAMATLAATGPQRWVHSLLLLGLATGQRRADLAKMRFDDVIADDKGRQFLRIEQQKQAGKGYGARVEIPLNLRLDVIGMTVGEVIEHCRGSAKPGPTLLRIAGGGAIEESSLSARFHEHIVTVLGADAHQCHEWPSLHEMRSLSARCYLEQGLTMQTVQTLLGHKHAEMTQLYADDRGLSRDQWKRVEVPA